MSCDDDNSDGDASCCDTGYSRDAGYYDDSGGNCCSVVNCCDAGCYFDVSIVCFVCRFKNFQNSCQFEKTAVVQGKSFVYFKCSPFIKDEIF